jgi:hypothetical protein
MTTQSRTQHAHLLRLEASGRWRIIGTAKDGGDIVDWWLDSPDRRRLPAAIYRTVACDKQSCAQGAWN